MAFTNAQLALKISQLINYWQGFNEEYASWLGGSAVGGENSDGKFPLTDWNGITYLVESPQKLALNVNDLVSGAQGFANAASGSADTAAYQADVSTTQAGLADAARIAAEQATVNAQSAESSATDAKVTAIAQANLATDRAGYAQEWAESMTPVSAAAGGDGSSTYGAKYWASIAEGFTGDIDTSLYTLKGGDETVTGSWTFDDSLVFNQGKKLRSRDTGGTIRDLLFINGNDNIILGDNARRVVLYGDGQVPRWWTGSASYDLLHTGGGQDIDNDLKIAGRLHLQGAVSLTPSNGTTKTWALIKNENGAENIALAMNGDGSSDRISFFTDYGSSGTYTERMSIIAATGNVGINNPAPNQALDVGGSIEATGSITAGGSIILDTNNASWLYGRNSDATASLLFGIQANDNVIVGNHNNTISIRSSNIPRWYDGSTDRNLLHTGGGQTVGGKLTLDSATYNDHLRFVRGAEDWHITPSTDGSLDIVRVGTTGSNPAAVDVPRLYATDAIRVGGNDVLHTGGGQAISGALTVNNKLTANNLAVTNATGNGIGGHVTVYDDGNAKYGMTLWNTASGGGDWATMIYGPNQSGRRISFGKVNNMPVAASSDITEGAYFDLDNWSLNLTGALINTGDSVFTDTVILSNFEKSNMTQSGQLGYDASQGLLIYRTQQNVTGVAVTVLDGANVTSGSGINITNLGSGTNGGGSGTEMFTFSFDTTWGDARYALSGHNHDSSYAAASHNHDGTYVKHGEDNFEIGGVKFYRNDGYGNMGLRFNSNADSTAQESGISWEIDVANDSTSGDFTIGYVGNLTGTETLSSHTAALTIAGGTGVVNCNQGLNIQGRVPLSHDSSSYGSGRVTFSTSAPSGGSNGDIWFEY